MMDKELATKFEDMINEGLENMMKTSAHGKLIMENIDPSTPQYQTEAIVRLGDTVLAVGHLVVGMLGALHASINELGDKS